MQPLYWALLLVLLYVYISYYYRYPTNITILQAKESQFSASLLWKKQPIVLMDVSTVSLPDIKKNLLPYLFSKQVSYIPGTWQTNPTKYLLLHSEQATEIHLLPATKKLTPERVPSTEDVLITLQVQPTQVVIVPFHWHYYTDTPFQTLGVHDLFSWLLP